MHDYVSRSHTVQSMWCVATYCSMTFFMKFYWLEWLCCQNLLWNFFVGALSLSKWNKNRFLTKIYSEDIIKTFKKFIYYHEDIKNGFFDQFRHTYCWGNLEIPKTCSKNKRRFSINLIKIIGPAFERDHHELDD